MGRYYYGDIEGKFMFAVQPSDAGCRFGAEEDEPYAVDYSLDRDSYDHLCKELKSIEDSGAVKRVKHMFESLEKIENKRSYGDEDCEKYKVTPLDLSEYADWLLGTKMKKFFDENPDRDTLSFNAEI